MNNLTISYLGIETFADDSQLIQAWLFDKSVESQKAYAIAITQFFAATGKQSLREINVRDILQWQLSLKHYATTSIATKIATIKSLYSFAVKVDYLTKNIMLAVKAPKSRDALHERLIEIDDVEKLLNHCSDIRYKLLFKLIAIAGLRISEAVNLKWSDCRVLANKVLMTVNGKGNKVRTVPIGFDLWSELTQLKNESQFIFSTSTGRAIDRKRPHDQLKKAARKAGINEKVSCHWLRHFSATQRIYNGQPINEISKILGHQDVAVTSRYLHVIDNNMRTDYVQLSV